MRNDRDGPLPVAARQPQNRPDPARRLGQRRRAHVGSGTSIPATMALMAREGELVGVPPAPADDVPDKRLGEPRWVPAAAVVVFMALNIAVRIWLPSEGVAHIPW